MNLTNQLTSAFVMVLALATVAEVVTRLFPRRPALGHLLWLSVLVRSLLPAIPALSGPSWAPTTTTGLPFLFPPEDLRAETAATTASPTMGWMGWLTVLWAAGTAWMIARSIQRSLAVRRLVRLATKDDGELTQLVREQALRLGVAAPRVFTLAGISSPFLYGVRRPRLIWPAAMSAPRARTSVITHELAHLRRADPWSSWIEAAARWVWWWNPVVWYAGTQTRRYKELACDALVVQAHPDARKGYAEALLDAAEDHSGSPLTARTLAWVGAGSRVKERLRSLYQVPHTHLSPAVVVAIAAGLGTTLLGWKSTDSVANPPPVVPVATPAMAETPAPVEATDPEPVEESASPTSSSSTASSAFVLTNSEDNESDLTDAERATLQSIGVESFEELEELCNRQIAVNPNNGRAHSRLGWALVSQGFYEDAIESFQTQYDLGHVTTYASYNVACCYALMDEVDLALEWLEKSVESGYDQPLALQEDSDMENLRDDPRFGELIQRLLDQSKSAQP